MDGMLTAWNNIQKYDKLKTGLSWKLDFWVAIMICATLIFTNPATSSSLLDENGNSEINEFFLKMNKTPMDLHELIEKLQYSNHTELFTVVDKNGTTLLHRAVVELPVLNQTLDILKAYHVDFNAVDDDGNSVFFKAVQFGRNVSFLTTLISYGVEWETRNYKNDTALHLAALYGNLPVINFLIAMESDVNSQNLEGRTPLHQAVRSTNISQETFDIVRELLSSGARTNISDENGKSALQLAKNMDNNNEQVKNFIVSVLVEAFNRRLESILDELNPLRRRPLARNLRTFEVIKSEDLDTIKSVLNYVGNSSNVTEILDFNNHSLLHVAIKYRDYSIVEYLINDKGFANKLNDTKFNANLAELCMENIQSTSAAKFAQKLKTLQLLFRIQPDLIESRFEINIGWDEKYLGWEYLYQYDRVTPLHYSAARVFSNGKQLELVQMLINSSANVNATTSEHNITLLQFAAHNNQFEIIRVLLENHGDVNAINRWGDTFLQVVAERCSPDVLHEALKYLDSINNTNSFTIRNKDGETILYKAVERMEPYNETLEMLKRRGIDFNLKDDGPILFSAIKFGRSFGFLENLIAFGADWRLKDGNQNTALHIAALWGNLDALKLFIQLGADVNALNRKGETPLHLSLLPNYDVVTKLDVVTELIKHGANVGTRTKLGKLAIDLAREKIKYYSNLLNKRSMEDGVIQLLENTQNYIH